MLFLCVENVRDFNMYAFKGLSNNKRITVAALQGSSANHTLLSDRHLCVLAMLVTCDDFTCFK